MTEREFRIRLSKLLWFPPKSTFASTSGGTYEDTDYFEFEKQIFALIKEAGYKSPEEIELAMQRIDLLQAGGK